MELKGKVLDSEMRIIPGANIQVIGTGNATTTNGFGDFTINVAGTNSILRFSHAAYDYDEVSVADFISNGNRVELWSPSLDEVPINNNYKKPDNTLTWILGITLAGFIAKALFGNNKPEAKPKKVTL